MIKGFLDKVSALFSSDNITIPLTEYDKLISDLSTEKGYCLKLQDMLSEERTLRRHYEYESIGNRQIAENVELLFRGENLDLLYLNPDEFFMEARELYEAL